MLPIPYPVPATFFQLLTNTPLYGLYFILISYLLGSLPTGLLLGKVFGIQDLRQIGSGNIGATNALRTGNKKLAVLTLLGDLLKGSLAVWLFQEWGDNFAMGAGFLAILGHVFPLWLKFKGGKGVATSLGVFLALTPSFGLTLLAIWILCAFAFKYSSLAALIATALSVPMSIFSNSLAPFPTLCLGVTILLFYTHRFNIQRLLKGTEPKIGEKSSPSQKTTHP